MKQSFDNFDKPYRRGLVLGLSLAEVFLILLFLLLLTSVGLTSSLLDEINELDETKEELEDRLNFIEESTVGKEITIADFVRLEKKINALEKINKELSDQLDDLKEDLAETEKELIKVEEKLAEAEKELVIAGEEAAKKDQVIDEYAKNGQDPPCWFVNIPDADEASGIRQRHVKIFDVKIEDDFFSVRRHDNSKIKLKIDRGNIAALPQVGSTILNKKLSAREFTQKFSQFKAAGNEKLIQNYKCRFMVDVFDATSINNKSGYKRNLRVIENLFYKFEESGQW
jgi:DNA repair exonuclease SbcCD ATPase subunit